MRIYTKLVIRMDLE